MARFLLVLICSLGVTSVARGQTENSKPSKAAAAKAAKLNKQLRVGVTDFAYDDISSVLDAIGVSYRKTGDYEKPFNHFDVVFVGCGSTEAAEFNPHDVLEFVKRGGVLYVSDLSYHILEASFPDLKGQWRTRGSAGRKACRVLDQNLVRILGEKITLNFDASNWASRTSRAKLDVWIELGGRRKPVPVLWKYQHGNGSVIYTSFHNHANASDVEQKLIRALVELPLDRAIEINSQLQAGVGDPKELLKRLAEQRPISVTVENAAEMDAAELAIGINWSDASQREIALDELVKRKGTEATLALGAAVSFASEEHQADVRAKLVARMQRMKPSTLERYLAYEDDAEIREAAAVAAGAKAAKTLLAALAERLTDREDRVADAAHATLVKLTDQDFGKFVGAKFVERFVVAKRWKAWVAKQAAADRAGERD